MTQTFPIGSRETKFAPDISLAQIREELPDGVESSSPPAVTRETKTQRVKKKCICEPVQAICKPWRLVVVQRLRAATSARFRSQTLPRANLAPRESTGVIWPCAHCACSIESSDHLMLEGPTSLKGSVETYVPNRFRGNLRP